MITFASVHAGFSLLEVLITVVIVSIGLLGLAGLQATGLQNNQKAYHRSQATVLAYDLTDRIRANTVSIDDYLPPSTPTAHDSCGGCAHAIATVLANCNGQGCVTAVAAIQANCATAGGGCTTPKMAQNDLFEWNTALSSKLPNGIGTIIPDLAKDPVLYTVSITWDEKNRKDGNPTTSFDVSFTLE